MGRDYLKYSVHYVLSQFVSNQYDVLTNEGGMAIEYTREFEALFNRVLPEQLMYRLEFGRLREIYIVYKKNMDVLKEQRENNLDKNLLENNRSQKRSKKYKSRNNQTSIINEEPEIPWSFEVSAPYLARYCFLMAQINEEEQPRNEVVELYLEKLLLFLVENKSKYLSSSNYDAVSPEYFRLMC